MVMTVTGTETRLERPAPRDTLTQTGSVDIDELPPPPPVVPRDTEQRLRDLLAAVRYQLHRVEAQATSLGRELVSSDHVGERALHLVTSTIGAARTALRVVDQAEVP